MIPMEIQASREQSVGSRLEPGVIMIINDWNNFQVGPKILPMSSKHSCLSRSNSSPKRDLSFIPQRALRPNSTEELW